MELVAELVILIATIILVGYPLFSKKGSGEKFYEEQPNVFQKLLSKRDMIYSALKELEFDYNTDKLSEKDYEDMKSHYEIEAVNILEQIDNFDKKKEKPQKSQLICSQCQKPYSTGDKFCPSCGNKL